MHVGIRLLFCNIYSAERLVCQPVPAHTRDVNQRGNYGAGFRHLGTVFAETIGLSGCCGGLGASLAPSPGQRESGLCSLFSS